MPANLPPQYFEAEKAFREAKDPLEKIAALEEMLAIMPKHKGTDHLRAELRGRIAKLTQMAARKSGARRASLMIEKEGAAQLAVVGPPNCGKSRIIDAVTSASPTVADYPFTTHQALPGMMEFENIKIQLIDTPPLAPQSTEFWMPPLLRKADALLVVVDLSYDPLAQMESVIEQLKKMRIILGESESNGEADPDYTLWHQKALVIGNKRDFDTDGRNFKALQSAYGERFPTITISATEGAGLEELKGEIYRVLDIIRVYTKAPGKKPDPTDPIILKRGSTLADAAEAVHKDFRAKMKYARVWGSAKHDGVMARRDHVLEDGDIIELHL
ncbi:MAG: TGS domain-containing protein [Dehalococcoidia bacterium]|jgi:ribosome-interacting GTPase 1